MPPWRERGRMGIYTRSDQLLPTDLIDGEAMINVLRRLPVVLPLRPELLLPKREDDSVINSLADFLRDLS